ncbi:tetrahydrofolate dehydrogenase/cyclohydrolase catalytic domain-containing protein [Clostridium sp.]|jgi:methylenetetrahydrofolate dehydrogenase (NADP+)/methenyltetrahydrofolate cyclohydrolase|uniref:bifunctional 5,10-methylenetetrahydrofolate dehydrogenase/5,10-methenyltetrahydrofolate cyclohydrolase n=1 Tax=Clostridium sp. TaxID=1506 RepID=UPI00258A1D9C|nr:tetrahydrofolate dehydrogenase/cyclohydrolase catalytic domain-containing protein [Clostridium sp.]MDF2503328.1 5,10-methylene-tetrahydrofolate dehydrogenase/methenyl tetrahydrofolate cyclohydrolase [Clostridium sp.]
MGNIIQGKLVAENFRNQIKDFIKYRNDNNLNVPSLAIILVGSDGGSQYYVRNAKKLCDNLGVNCEILNFDEDKSEIDIINAIEVLNNREDIQGIMLQLPLPDNFDEKKIVSTINGKKDVDGLTDINIGKFYSGEKSFVPCTPKGIIELIKSTGEDISGKNAVVIGRSNIVGKPVAQLLLNNNATVTICHSKTKNLKEVCSNADILICAIGRPDFVDESFIKKGAIVIDVGTTMIEGKLKGDVKFESAIQKAGFLTPVPGGVGAMTTTMLLMNTCEALK